MSFILLILLILHDSTPEEQNPYAIKYNYWDFIQSMYHYETNNISYGIYSVVLKYINIMYEKHSHSTMPIELAFYNFKVYLEFEQLIPPTSQFSPPIYFIKTFGFCNQFEILTFYNLMVEVKIKCEEIKNISDFLEINSFEKIDEYIPCNSVIIDLRVDYNSYKEKIFLMTVRRGRSSSTVGLVLHKKKFSVFGMKYAFEYSIYFWRQEVVLFLKPV